MNHPDTRKTRETNCLPAGNFDNFVHQQNEISSKKPTLSTPKLLLWVFPQNVTLFFAQETLLAMRYSKKYGAFGPKDVMCWPKMPAPMKAAAVPGDAEVRLVGGSQCSITVVVFIRVLHWTNDHILIIIVIIIIINIITSCMQRARIHGTRWYKHSIYTMGKGWFGEYPRGLSSKHSTTCNVSISNFINRFDSNQHNNITKSTHRENKNNCPVPEEAYRIFIVLPVWFASLRCSHKWNMTLNGAVQFMYSKCGLPREV